MSQCNQDWSSPRHMSLVKVAEATYSHNHSTLEAF
jgi:hypothetical protein